MEALNFSTFRSKFVESYSSCNSRVSSLLKFPFFGDGFHTHTNSEVLRLSSHRSGFRALSDAVSGGGEGGEGAPWNASAFPGLELKHNTREVGIQSSGSETEEQNIVTPFTSANGPIGPGTRNGLFRTPISGGVHSATSAHDLPPPALAVRNLMEQARFAHLCTLMSPMHHHRAGYPFGSLVDFAADSMGHPIFSLSPLAIHTRNLLVDPRCSLVVQIPGWSGLSNVRVTIFGDAIPLPANQQEWAC